jgi:imidazolonepropionase
LGSAKKTVAVLLPGTAFYLKAQYAPARALIDGGACVAIATDFNPGSCMSNNLNVMMTLAALYMKMSRAEIFASVTYNAAKALGFEEQFGSIAVGKKCSVQVLDVERFEELYYRFG